MLIVLVLSLCLAIACGALLGREATQPGPAATPTIFLVRPHMHLYDVARELEAQHDISSAWLFFLVTVAGGEARHLKAGEYALPPHLSLTATAALLASGKTVVRRLTVPEGLTTQDVMALVGAAPGLVGAITLRPVEGELLPETYYYAYGDTHDALLARMRAAMQRLLADAWPTRAKGLPLATPLQAVTLASIVEKETSLKDERPHVAAVYLNRLTRHMLLQADPTTAYAVTGGAAPLRRSLTAADLALASPYNTYYAPGLPPGPIANPGRASLLAALHPAPSRDLYFVATGSGGHYFSETREQHEERVRRYRAWQHARPAAR